MTEAQKKDILELRANRVGYKRIANELGLTLSCVKSFCTRNGLGATASAGEQKCPSCGTKLIQLPGRKKKKFCSDVCRMKWWNCHLDQVKRKATHKHECPVCHKSFFTYGSQVKKYCSHNCYIKDRFGGALDEKRTGTE